MAIPEWVDKRMNDAMETAKHKPDPLRMLTFPVIAIKGETDKAYLFITDKGDFWFPKSQIILDEEKKEVTAPAWLKDKIFNKPPDVPPPSKPTADARTLFVQGGLKVLRQKYPELTDTAWKLFLIGMIIEE